MFLSPRRARIRHERFPVHNNARSRGSCRACWIHEDRWSTLSAISQPLISPSQTSGVDPHRCGGVPEIRRVVFVGYNLDDKTLRETTDREHGGYTVVKMGGQICEGRMLQRSTVIGHHEEYSSDFSHSTYRNVSDSASNSTDRGSEASCVRQWRPFVRRMMDKES